MGITAVVLLCLSMTAVIETPAVTPGDTLIQAIRNDDLAYLKAQLGKAADVNTRGRRETTLLMYAAAFGSPEAVQLLLDSGADVNAAALPSSSRTSKAAFLSNTTSGSHPQPPDGQ